VASPRAEGAVPPLRHGARLSEDATSKVVLLEAGGNDNHFWIHVPLDLARPSPT